jgi:hypothetical protein
VEACRPDPWRLSGCGRSSSSCLCIGFTGHPLGNGGCQESAAAIACEQPREASPPEECFQRSDASPQAIALATGRPRRSSRSRGVTDDRFRPGLERRRRHGEMTRSWRQGGAVRVGAGLVAPCRRGTRGRRRRHTRDRSAAVSGDPTWAFETSGSARWQHYQHLARSRARDGRLAWDRNPWRGGAARRSLQAAPSLWLPATATAGRLVRRRDVEWQLGRPALAGDAGGVDAHCAGRPREEPVVLNRRCDRRSIGELDVRRRPKARTALTIVDRLHPGGPSDRRHVPVAHRIPCSPGLAGCRRRSRRQSASSMRSSSRSSIPSAAPDSASKA